MVFCITFQNLVIFILVLAFSQKHLHILLLLHLYLNYVAIKITITVTNTPCISDWGCLQFICMKNHLSINYIKENLFI